MEFQNLSKKKNEVKQKDFFNVDENDIIINDYKIITLPVENCMSKSLSSDGHDMEKVKACLNSFSQSLKANY